jgi:hypothetical protein
MPEYFIKANSFAAPFFSDDSSGFVEAGSPEAALESFATAYSHPAGLYAAAAYASADAFHKGEGPLAKWLCNHEIRKQELTKDLPSYSYLGRAPGDFEIDRVRHVVPDPKGGRVVALAPEASDP